jgi:hypothetical protein
MLRYEVTPQERARVRAMSEFTKDRQGRIEASLPNLVRALKDPTVVGCALAFDEHRGEMMIAELPGEWRTYLPEDFLGLRVRLEALGFKGVRASLLGDALMVIRAVRRFDSSMDQPGEVIPGRDAFRVYRERSNARER